MVRGERNARQESTPKETELTTSTPLFLGNAKSKNEVSFFVTSHREVTLSRLSLYLHVTLEINLKVKIDRTVKYSPRSWSTFVRTIFS